MLTKHDTAAPTFPVVVVIHFTIAVSVMNYSNLPTGMEGVTT